MHDISPAGEIARGIEAIIAEVKFTPASYLRAAKQIRLAARPELRSIRIGILASFTANLLEPYLVTEGARRGLAVEPYFGPFNQFEQSIFDPASALYDHSPEVIVIALRIEDLFPDIWIRSLSHSPELMAEVTETVVERTRALIAGVRLHSQATVVVFNHADMPVVGAGLADPRSLSSFEETRQAINRRLAAECRNSTDAYLFDYSRVVGALGLRDWTDPKLWHLGRIPFSTEAQVQVGSALARFLRALLLAPKKCLVVDLDNTLWGGVVGEDGINGIDLGEDFPGNAFKAFQRYLLALRARGILLAVASKNDFETAAEVFESHPDCLMNMEHFAAYEIHWQDKATSLRNIASTLSLGLDSLVFFDDSEIERELVATALPEVTVIDVPNDPTRYVEAVERAEQFDVLEISSEDRARGEAYRSESLRRGLRRETGNLEDFLRGLDIHCRVGRLDADSMTRITQMLAKTNQFNLTTRRHDAAKLREMLDEGAIALWLRVADRIGDSGMVGVGIAVPDNDRCWRIDSFLLSCRVIGRNVEYALLHCLAKAVAASGGAVLRGEFVASKRNHVAAGFLSSAGLVQVEGQTGLWELALAPDAIAVPDYISVEFNDIHNES
jgi:FkbH-like protein